MLILRRRGTRGPSLLQDRHDGPDPAAGFALHGCRGTVTIHERDMTVIRIISGGQTGADRAGLDFAITHSIPHGGWCPKRRRAENGRIPAKYQLQECKNGRYSDRTKRNVLDSDATVIFTVRPYLIRGSKLTYVVAVSNRKPVLHLHAGTTEPARRLAAFIRQHRVKVLNVAGSRASQEPTVGTFVAHTLDLTLNELRRCTR